MFLLYHHDIQIEFCQGASECVKKFMAKVGGGVFEIYRKSNFIFSSQHDYNIVHC